MLIRNLLNRVALREGFSLRPTSAQATRLYTSDASNFEVVKDRHQKDYVILKLNRAPVNSFDCNYMKDLTYQLNIFEDNKALKGVIITSDLPNVFSAGLNLMELYESEPRRLENLWVAVQKFWVSLYGSKKVYIAAINGHAMALGCLLAISCDYRIMASEENTKIGLSASLLGITPPSWIKDTMVNTIGHREAEKALQLGKVYTPQEALKINLVDEIVAKKDVLAAAEEQMKIWCKIPSEARGISKHLMRAKTLDAFTLNQIADLQEFVNSVSSPSVQKSIEGYLQGLKNQHKYL